MDQGNDYVYTENQRSFLFTNLLTFLQRNTRVCEKVKSLESSSLKMKLKILSSDLFRLKNWVFGLFVNISKFNFFSEQIWSSEMELLQTNNWLFCCITTQTGKKPFVSSLPQCRKEALFKFVAYFHFYIKEREISYF